MMGTSQDLSVFICYLTRHNSIAFGGGSDSDSTRVKGKVEFLFIPNRVSLSTSTRTYDIPHLSTIKTEMQIYRELGGIALKFERVPTATISRTDTLRGEDTCQLTDGSPQQDLSNDTLFVINS